MQLKCKPDLRIIANRKHCANFFRKNVVRCRSSILVYFFGHNCCENILKWSSVYSLCNSELSGRVAIFCVSQTGSLLSRFQQANELVCWAIVNGCDLFQLPSQLLLPWSPALHLHSFQDCWRRPLLLWSCRRVCRYHTGFPRLTSWYLHQVYCHLRYLLVSNFFTATQNSRVKCTVWENSEDILMYTFPSLGSAALSSKTVVCSVTCAFTCDRCV